MLPDLLLVVADAILSYVVDKLDPAEKLKTWLKKEPSRLALQKALARAYTAFARQYPEYTASLFDQSFLANEAAPDLAKLLIRGPGPDPALLAQAWGRSLGAKPEFSQKAIQPASRFLEWLDAELKAEPVFQALFDSRALDSLPRIEAELKELTREFSRDREEALKAAEEYEKIVLKIGGDIRDSVFISGNVNQISISNIYNNFYTENFVSLNEYYIYPDELFKKIRVQDFVGREWLTTKVDDFLNSPKHKSGYFLLVGEAGVGKTAFMAHLVKERRYLHVFGEQVRGDANVQRALQSLGSQLVTRYQIDPYKDRDTLTQLATFPDFLERLLRLAAGQLTNGEKIVIVCDALDEAGVFLDGNVLGLPNILPDGVYFILSQRPVNVKLPDIVSNPIPLEAMGQDNLQDMETYLTRIAKRPEIAGQIHAQSYSEAFFIKTLKEKSLGVWMYLHYVIREIEDGSRAPLDLSKLPTGLVGYYANYWDDWRNGRSGRGEGKQKWHALYAPLLATLTAAQEPITAMQLKKWAGVNAPEYEVRDLLREDWSAFIAERDGAEGKVYAPYHLSLRDFITGKVDLDTLTPTHQSLVRDLTEQTLEAHHRIIQDFKTQCQGVWEKLVEQEYPRRYLTTHLAATNDYKTLIPLLTEGEEHINWAEARYQKEDETYAGYLTDLALLWDYAEKQQDYALAIRCMLIESSIHSLASNISPELLSELAKAGLWSYARCLSTIRQMSENRQQAEALRLIAQDFPILLHAEVLITLREIRDEYSRASVLTDLAPHLSEELKGQALAAAREIRDESVRASALTDLVPHLSEELKGQALTTAREIRDEYSRASVLTDLAPHLSEELKGQVLSEALAAAREIRDEYSRASVLTALAPHLSEELKGQALAAAREIRNEYFRASVLTALAPHLSEELKGQAFSEALAAAREIRDEYSRASVLTHLAPHLSEELKGQALATAREIRDESVRASVLTALAPHLSEELKGQALATAREICDESVRASVLTDLVPHLSEELKGQALAAAREIREEYYRASALTDLVPHLSEELKGQALSEALTTAREIRDEYSRAIALTALAPHLSEELKRQVLSEALITLREIRDEYSRASVLTDLAPHLSEELKGQALAAAREIRDEYYRASALTELAPHLSEELKGQTLSEALAAAREIRDESDRARALTDLVPHLSEELKGQVFSEALAAAREIRDEYYRARALTDLAPHLSEELKGQAFSEALAAAREIRDEYSRASVLTALAPYLSEELKGQVFSEALAAAREIRDESVRASALTDLVPHLSEELKGQALATAREIRDESVRARVLTDLVPHLSEELKGQALAAVREIRDEYYRASVLTDLVPHLSEELKGQVFSEALTTAREIRDEYSRASVLTDLVPHLSEELKGQAFSEAFAAAREIRDEYYRARALTDLAPHLSEELKGQALAAAREIRDEYSRASVLTDLAPHLSEELKGQAFSEAFAAAREIRDESVRAIVLTDLAPHLSEELKIKVYLILLYISGYREATLQDWKGIEFNGLSEHLVEIMKFTSEMIRSDSMQSLASLGLALICFSGNQIAADILRAIRNASRWWP